MRGTYDIRTQVVRVIAVAIETLLILGVVLAGTGILAQPVPNGAWPAPGGAGSWSTPAPSHRPLPDGAAARIPVDLGIGSDPAAPTPRSAPAPVR